MKEEQMTAHIRGLANLRLTVERGSLRSISRPFFFQFLVIFLSFSDFGKFFVREIFLTKNFRDKKNFKQKKGEAEKNWSAGKIQEIIFCIIKKIFIRKIKGIQKKMLKIFCKKKI